MLNPLGEVEWHFPTPVHVPSERVPKSPFLRGHGLVDLDVTIRVNPAHGEWVAHLREHAEVVWATTWEDLANEVVAPLLGIEPLQVATRITQHPPRPDHARNRDSAAWKADALSASYPGRPLVWVDDSASEYRAAGEPSRHGHAFQGWRHPHPTLVLVPDPSTGLTAAHQQAVAAFVATHQ